MRIFFTVAAIAAIVTALAVLLAFFPHLPAQVPSNIGGDGVAQGSIPSWTLFLPLLIEALIAVAILTRAGNLSKIRNETGRAAAWLALGAGFWLVARAEWMQMQSALHPGTLHPMSWYDYALVAAILAGVAVTALNSQRRPGEN